MDAPSHTIGQPIELIVGQRMLPGFDRKAIRMVESHLLEALGYRLLNVLSGKLLESSAGMNALAPDSALRGRQVLYSVKKQPCLLW